LEIAMKQVTLFAALTGAALLLGGCGTVQNTSLLDGSHQFGRAEMNTYPVRVLAIDKDYVIDRNPVRAEPGQRTLRVTTAPVGGFTEPPIKDVSFTVEPCKRYYLAAKRQNALSQDFTLIVQQVEDRPDCTKS
jgi:hypothetical protein